LKFRKSPETYTCKNASTLELPSDEEVWLQSKTYPWFAGTTILDYKTEYEWVGYSGIAVINVWENRVDQTEFINVALSETENAYRQARDVVLKKCGQQASD
jgi:hypothetical protein